MGREADDATRELIHDDQDPVRFQQERLAAEPLEKFRGNPPASSRKSPGGEPRDSSTMSTSVTMLTE